MNKFIKYEAFKRAWGSQAGLKNGPRDQEKDIGLFLCDYWLRSWLG